MTIRIFVAISVLIATPSSWAVPPMPASVRESLTFKMLPLGHVGVVSLFGSTFHGVGLGLTVFNNFAFSAAVPDWGIDEDTASFLQSTLSEGGYTAARLNIQPKTSDDLYIKDGKVDQPDLVELRRLATEQGFDTIISVERGAARTYYPTIVPIPGGYGLYERGAFGIAHQVYPYAQFFVRVVEVKTGKVIKSDIGNAAEGYPSKAIPWTTKFEDLSDDKKSLIKRGIEEHIHHELTRTLGEMRVLKPES